MLRINPPQEDIPLASSLPKNQKEAIILKFLQESEGMCILHILSSGDASHKLFKCTIYPKFSLSYHRFRSGIFFSKQGICYRCGVLTSDRFDHPLRSKGGDAVCKFDDILKPLSFAIYSVPSLREVVIPEAGAHPRDFASAADYAKWLGDIRPGSQSMFNLWEVCLSYIHLLNHSRYAYPSLIASMVILISLQDSSDFS
jgi:hypothetical protein